MLVTIPAIAIGLLIGLIALFPGFHFSMILLFVGPGILHQLGPAGGILCMASAVCVAKCMHSLAVVYHPVSADNIASADPAQRLAASGQGSYATNIISDAMWFSTRFVAIVLGLIVVFGEYFQTNLIKELTKIGTVLTIPAILAWVTAVLITSRSKIGTLVALGASGTLGVYALMSPHVEGSSHTMTPLLTGLFAIPVLIGTLVEKHSSRKKIHLQKQDELEVEDDLKLLGLVFGTISVLLPGLGTSSLVSIGQKFTESDAEYLSMASFAESTGEMMALILGIMSIASRSSDAAIIQQVIDKTTGEIAINSGFIFLLLGTLVVSCWLGIKLLGWVSFPYKVMMNLIPVKIQALIVAIAMIAVVWHHTQWWGIAVLVSGTLIHLGAKKLHVSNQVFFACMITPMLFSIVGFNPF